MIGPIIGLLISLFFLVAILAELFSILRRRRRYVRAPGVYVATRDARGELGQGPGVHKRAAYFRFTTREGRVVTAESRVQSFPGPKVGKRCTVLYDPERPYKAETSARLTAILLFFLPLGLVISGGAVIFNLVDLLAASG